MGHGAGWLLDVCLYEDPLFVQAFDQGEVETTEEWIHLKAMPGHLPHLPKRGGVVLRLCRARHSTMCGLIHGPLQLPDPKRKKGRSGHRRKMGKKLVQAPAPTREESGRPAHTRGEHEHPTGEMYLAAEP
ncbi:UNVERIFIED_CONTAM: hypothetical protein FKN15_042873 [Acipenser sinensis]